MTNDSELITWTDKHEFLVTGSERHEDTLRIDCGRTKSEQPMRLVLPTLCITYADMKFANALGGEQTDYPDSAAYGPTFFDPPVEIVGEAEVERLTWIRGAHRVQIGPRQTEIDWAMWKSLVIPRLRIRTDKPATAVLTVDGVPIGPGQKVDVLVRQYADGRHVGGITVSKRHPSWEPEEQPREYDLHVRVLDGQSGRPLAKVPVVLLSQVSKGSGGAFVEQARLGTDANGNASRVGLPTGELQAVVLELPGYRVTPRCFRPLPGQKVSLLMRAWRLRREDVVYHWGGQDTLERVEMLTAMPRADLLARCKLALDAPPGADAILRLPCYRASYALEPRDSLAWLVGAFAYRDLDELCLLNGCQSGTELADREIHLHGWFFVHAPAGDALERLDRAFGLPSGWVRPVGRVHRPDPERPYPGEILAVPTRRFAEDHASQRVLKQPPVEPAGIVKRLERLRRS